MTKKINMVPEDFEKAVGELQKIEDLLNDYQAELSCKYTTMINDWQGEAGVAFNESGQKVLDDFEINIENLSQLTMSIKQAGQFMQNVDQSFTGAIISNTYKD